MLNVLAKRPEVHGFKTGRGDGLLVETKIRSTLPTEEKKSRRPQVLSFYGMQRSLESMNKILRKAKFIIPFAISACFATRRLLPQLLEE
jgi:hypothetical protein